MESNQEKVLLIDANSILYRIFFSTKKLVKDKENNISFFDKNGSPINILKSFVEIFIKYKTKTFYDYKIIVAFDHPERETYRHKYSFYKSNRKKDEDYYSIFLPQYKLILQFLYLFKIKTLQSRKLEADDIIGILSKRFSKSNNLVEIITSDKDLFQLIDKNISVNLLIQGRKKFTKVTEENLNEFISLNLNSEKIGFNVTPKQIIDIKSIGGDASDNISGVIFKNDDNKIKKITLEKTLELLKKHGTLERLIEYSSEQKDKSELYSQIYSQRQKLVRNKHIISIITDYKNLGVQSASDIKVEGEINFKHLYLFLDRYNLNHIIKIVKKRKEEIIS